MKKLIFPLLSVLAIEVSAQNVNQNEVPSEVKAKFNALHPDVTNTKWNKEKDNYEASFRSAKEGESSVLLDPRGNVLETEVQVEVAQLPKAITDYVFKQYNGEKITEAMKVKDAQGTTTYTAELKDKNLIFDAEGKFLKETKKEKGLEKEHKLEKETH